MSRPTSAVTAIGIVAVGRNTRRSCPLRSFLTLGVDGTVAVTLTAPGDAAYRLDVLDGSKLLGTVDSAAGRPASRPSTGAPDIRRSRPGAAPGAPRDGQ